MANVNQEPLHPGSAMVDTSGTDQRCHANERNSTITILPQWDTKDKTTFAAWDIKLRTNVDARTFDGFVDYERPSFEIEAAAIIRMGTKKDVIRLEDIRASLDLTRPVGRI